MNEQRTKDLEALKAIIQKQHGKGSVTQLSDVAVFDNDKVIKTGSIGLDIALGIGGYPKGRIVEIIGAEACIHGDTFLQYEVWQKEKRINQKGGSIARLYERFTGNINNNLPKQGRSLQLNNSEFYIKSVDSNGSIIRNKVLDVVKTEIKKCVEIKTLSGNNIISSYEHKFLTPSGFKSATSLEIGETIFIHNNTRRTGKKNYTCRPEVFVKYHPKLPKKIVKDSKTNKNYIYHRGQKSRMAYEAFLNKMTYEKYIETLNSKSKEIINTFHFIPDNVHVHHIDENFLNNNIENLELISPQKHGQLHAKDRKENLSYVVIPTKIISISEVGKHQTYDLKCMYPYNNYIANGIVVHNSGKSTTCLHAIANVQADNGMCAFIDTEHSLDVTYARNLGVDVDALLLSQPNYGEQALDIVEMMCRSGLIDLIIIDSVSALTPKAEIEGEMGDHHVGAQARLMSQALRKLVAITNQTNTCIIFTNQYRMKIGVMFGDPRVGCVHPNTKVELVIE
jgi:RecA/RadA recombinase